jgi:ketosteroid isomerase-like protein
MRRTYDAFNRRDLDALLALMDPDVEAVSRLAAMEGGYHGHDGIRRWWQNLLDTFPDFAIEIVDVRDPGDLTLATLRIHARGADSDTPVEETIWLWTRWQRRKCLWWCTYETEAEALAAEGLRE